MLDRPLGNGVLGTLSPPLPKHDPAYVEGVVARIRTLYGMVKTPGRPETRQGIFWDCVLDERGRRYFLSMVKLPPELATLPAREMTQGHLFAVFDGFLRAREYFEELSGALYRARRG